MEKTIKIIDIAGRIDKKIIKDDAVEIIKIINNYSNDLNFLDDYDYKNLIKQNGTISEYKVNYDNCKNIVNKLRFNGGSEVFARERNNGLESIIGNIYQTFNGTDIYPIVEEKAQIFYISLLKIMFL